ncbi:MAG: ATP-binding protein [Nitrospinota bacterium]
MISKFWKNSKLTGQLGLVFITLFSVILILSYFNFRTLEITSLHQKQMSHSLKQLLMLRKLESTIHNQLQEALKLIVREDGNFEEFDSITDRVKAVFLEAQYFLKNNPEYEAGIASEELAALQELEKDYSKLTTQLKNLAKNSAALPNSEKLSKINNLIEEEFDRKIQVFISEAAFNETKELEEIKTRDAKKNEKEFIIAWSLIGLSLAFSFFAYKKLLSSVVSKKELEKINQALEKEIIKKEDIEAQAKSERQNLYNMLDSLPMAFHLQAPDYSVPFANKVFRERFGTNLKKPCYDLMHDRSTPCEVCTTFKVFDHNKNETAVWDAADGKTYLTVCTPFKDIDGSPLVMEMALDITEQEKAKREAEAAMAQAKKANEAKSEFLARMSHELRTPLNSILGFSQLLLMDQMNSLQPLQKENVDRIVKGGQHLLELINEVLDLSKIESGSSHLNSENVSLRYLTNEICEIIEPMAANYNIKVKSTLEGNNDLIVYADRIRLKQVLLNLASNAIKYNKTNGEILITCLRFNEDKIKISISDTGIGISEKDLERIFEPFQRVQPSGTEIEGTGIGLSISKQLLKTMRGSIEVESEPGKGSCFNITIPAAEGELDTFNPAKIIEPVVLKNRIKTGKDYKILYIEDNLANMEMVGCALFRPNIQFLQAPDARLGIDIAKAHKPDLILMDINLPGMDGYEALRIIRQDPDIGWTPVFAMSANCMEKDIVNGLANGFDEYIPKPIKIPEFVEKVDSVLK